MKEAARTPFGPSPLPTLLGAGGPRSEGLLSEAQVMGPYEAPESPLLAVPGRVDFTGESAPHAPVSLLNPNPGDGPVIIDDVQVLGSPAFQVDVMGSNVVPFGGAARLVVDYIPPAEVGASGLVDVATSDGAHLHVPVTGLAQSHMVSSRAESAIEVFPEALAFEPTEVDGLSTRSLSLINRSLRPQEMSGLSADPKEVGVVPGQPQFRELGFAGTPPFTIFGAAPRAIGPGETVQLEVAFSPDHVGTDVAHVAIEADGGATQVGWVRLVGHAVEPRPHGEGGEGHEGSEEATHETGKAHDEETKPENAAAAGLRGQALRALTEWTQAGDHALTTGYKLLVKEWGDYISKTASNPTISGGELPVESIGALVRGHMMGAVLAKAAEEVVVHVAEHAAEHAATHLGTAAIGAGVGAVLGPPGAAMGFIVGVAVEVIVGLLFRWLSGEEDEVAKALEEARDEGFAEGSRHAGELLSHKLGELNVADDRAHTHLDAMVNAYRGLVMQHGDAAHLRQLLAEINGHTSEARAIKPRPGLADDLMAIWLREHAGGPEEAAKDVSSAQWKEVRAELIGKHRSPGMQPDLFLAQCKNEWRLRGLPEPPELEASVLAELGLEAGDQQFDGNENEKAKLAHERFNLREMVWTGVSNLSARGLPSSAIAREMQIFLADEGAQAEYTTAEEVLCYPILEVRGPACYVKEWQYRIRTAKESITARTHPGESKWEVVSGSSKSIAAPETSHSAASAELYGLMIHLTALGVDIAPQPDAEANPWLRAMFGDRVAKPRVQHADGRPQAVTVFRAAAKYMLDESYLHVEGGLVMGSVDVPAGVEATNLGEMLMLRGGDSILVISSPGVA